LTCAPGVAAAAMTGPAIYVGGLAPPMEVYAARELQRYIYQVSGALPEIRSGADSIDGPGFIVGTITSNPLIARLVAEQRVAVSATDPGPQGYVLKKLRANGREVLVVAGSDTVGTLYGVYGLLQDHYGIAFYLGGDVLPDEKVLAGSLPEVNERKKPAVGIRGLLPWTNFPQSATSYSWEDWRFILDQMAKMRLNFLHIHNYNGEAGHNEMFHNVARGGITPRVWMATARSGHAWGGRPGWDPNLYRFGASDLFDDYDFGADCARHNEKLSNEQVFRKGVSEFQKVIAYAHTRGVRIGLGLDIDLLPPELKDFKANDPEVVSSRVGQVIADYPNLDYLLCFQSEGIPGDKERRRVWRIIFDGYYTAIRERAPQIRLAVAGWGISAEDVANLPPDVICAPISAYSDGCENGAIYGQREYWGCPWLERDGGSSEYYYPYNLHLSNTIKAWQGRAGNLRGFYCLTWRLTDAIDPKMSYIANAPWDDSGKYSSSEAVYREYAERNYGRGAAEAITKIINQNEPFASDWGECMATPPFSDTAAAQGYLLNIRWFSLHSRGSQGARLTASEYTDHQGVRNAPCTEGGLCAGFIEAGNWLRFDNVDFGAAADLFEARVAALGQGGEIDIHLDSLEASPLGVCTVESTSDWQNWVTRQTAIQPASGKHTVFLKFRGRSISKSEFAKANDQLETIDRYIAKAGFPAQRARLRLLRCRIAAEKDHIELNRNFGRYTWADLPGAMESWARNFVDRVTDISSLGNVVSSQNRFVQLNYVAKENALRKALTVQPPSMAEARGTHDGAVITWKNEQAGARGFHVYRDGRRVSQEILPPASASWVDHASGAFRYTVTAVAADGSESPPSVPVKCEAGRADRTSPQIVLISPPASVAVGQPAWVTARILDNRTYESISAQLNYRVPGHGSWNTLPMARRTKAVFTAVLPASVIGPEGLEYYVHATDGDNAGVGPVSAPAVPLSLISDPTPVGPVPAGPAALAQDKGSLSWSKPAGEVFWYRIYRSNDAQFRPGPDTFLTYVAAGTTRYQDNGLDWAGHSLAGTWHYCVTAVAADGGESSPSNPVDLDYKDGFTR
jgi:hypothetical protein